MVVDIMNYLDTVRERHDWQPIPNTVKEFFTKPIQTDPEEVDEIRYNCWDR